MVLPGHLAGGYLATRALLALAPGAAASFTQGQTAALLIIGTLAGEGPDLDLFLYRFFGRSELGNHREYVTHTPLFWICLCLVIAFAGWLTGSLFVTFIGWTILAGALSHLLFDSIEYGVRWLWPFSNRRFCLREMPDTAIEDDKKGTFAHYWRFLTGAYLRSWTVWAEAIVTIAAIWVAFVSYR